MLNYQRVYDVSHCTVSPKWSKCPKNMVQCPLSVDSYRPVKRFAQLENAQRRECKADLSPPAKIAGKKLTRSSQCFSKRRHQPAKNNKNRCRQGCSLAPGTFGWWNYHIKNDQFPHLWPSDRDWLWLMLGTRWGQKSDVWFITTRWGPPVISWFIDPINYSYKYHKP